MAQAEILGIVGEMGRMAAGSAMAEGDERAVRAARVAISRFPAETSIGEARERSWPVSRELGT